MTWRVLRIALWIAIHIGIAFCLDWIIDPDPSNDIVIILVCLSGLGIPFIRWMFKEFERRSGNE